jgi:hypothetical protein
MLLKLTKLINWRGLPLFNYDLVGFYIIQRLYILDMQEEKKYYNRYEPLFMVFLLFLIFSRFCYSWYQESCWIHRKVFLKKNKIKIESCSCNATHERVRFRGVNNITRGVYKGFPNHLLLQICCVFNCISFLISVEAILSTSSWL